LSVKCKICGAEFKSERSLHTHIKAHGILLSEYYITYYPRYNLYTGELIPFKNKKQYFSTYFSNSDEIEKWLVTADQKQAKQILLKILEDRIISKNLQYAPNHLELKLLDLPEIKIYKEYFGSYNEACRRLQVEPLLNKSIKSKFLKDNKNLNDMEILIDTREQTPLKFPNSKPQKLDFGDYTAAGENYNKTYVDRKSETDFKSTMTVGFERFKKELERARKFDSFLYVVTESSIDRIINNNSFGAHKSNLTFVWHQMRVLSHEYAKNCQFIFSGGRNRSENLIPILLNAGEGMWYSDVQFYIDNRKIKI
jgi:hypothetical protein